MHRDRHRGGRDTGLCDDRPGLLDEATVGARTGRSPGPGGSALAGSGGKGDSHACGMALSADGTTAYVCLSRNNTLGVVDLAGGSSSRRSPSASPRST